MRVIDELDRRGIRVWLMDGTVRAFPKVALSDDTRRFISEHRDELVEIEAQMPMPCINTRGSLVIPHNSPKHYHWWAGGQSLKQTLCEFSEPNGEAASADNDGR